MKKILVFFVVVFGIVGGAMAKEEDYTASDDFLCAKVDTELYRDGSRAWELHGPYQKIQMFFDKGSKTDIGLHEGCEAEYKKIANILKGKRNDIVQLVFIGSADEQNASGNFDNRDLANRRAGYAEKYFDAFARRIHIAGDEDAKTYSPTTDNIVYRSVNIYVIYRNSTCQEDFVSNLAKFEQTINDTKEKYKDDADKIKKLDDTLARVKEAQRICPRAGVVLSATDNETLQKVYGAILDLAKIFPEIHQVTTSLNITQLTVSNTEINTYYSELSRIRDTFKLNEWRDAEGNFNTARLASDSIAGVVLGTVGGVVTAHLVKKNQLKKGFEDIQCHIGGQSVADYGDGFVVGR